MFKSGFFFKNVFTFYIKHLKKVVVPTFVGVLLFYISEEAQCNKPYPHTSF